MIGEIERVLYLKYGENLIEEDLIILGIANDSSIGSTSSWKLRIWHNNEKFVDDIALYFIANSKYPIPVPGHTIRKNDVLKIETDPANKLSNLVLFCKKINPREPSLLSLKSYIKGYITVEQGNDEKWKMLIKPFANTEFILKHAGFIYTNFDNFIIKEEPVNSEAFIEQFMTDSRDIGKGPINLIFEKPSKRLYPVWNIKFRNEIYISGKSGRNDTGSINLHPWFLFSFQIINIAHKELHKQKE